MALARLALSRNGKCYPFHAAIMSRRFSLRRKQTVPPPEIHLGQR